MIIEGQVHGGLTDGVGMALMEMIAFDEDGNCLGASLMDYLIPTALEVPDWETGFTVTPSPHHPIGAKGVGESATVGSPPAIVNAVVDALRAVRGPARRHAADPVAGVGRHARRTRRRRSEVSGAMSRGMAERGWTRCAPSARRSCTPPWSAPSSRPRRTPGDAAIVLRRRLDRGLRRRPVRRGVGAHGRAATRCATARRCCCGCCPSGEAPFPESPGAQVVVNPCLSGGALEIFLEPLLPPALVVVVGRGPIARRAGRAGRPARLPGRAGRRRAGTPRGRAGRGRGQPRRGRGGRDPGRAGRRGRPTSGWWPARAAARRCWPSSALDRRRAGPDPHPGRAWTSGPATPPEIALSILAEIVQATAGWTRRRRRRPPRRR